MAENTEPTVLPVNPEKPQGNAVSRGARKVVDRLKTDPSFRKKTIIIGIIVAVLVIAAIALAVVLINKNAASATVVKESKVEKGTISTTVEGSGTLENGTGTEINLPTGVMIDEVLVSYGDEVTAGQALAKVNKASVASVLIDVNSKLSSAESSYAAVSGASESADNTSYLKSLVYEKQCEDLSVAKASLDALLSDPTVYATADGTIGAVNVTAGSVFNGASSGSSGGSSSDSSSKSGSGSSSGSPSASKASSSKASTSMNTGTATQASFTVGSVGWQVVGTTTTTKQVESDASLMALAEPDSANKLKIDVEAPKTNAKPQTKLNFPPDTQYEGTIAWDCSTPTFQADTVYTATIELTAAADYAFPESIIPEVKGATVQWELLPDDAGAANKVLYIKAAFAKTASESSGGGQGGGSGSGGSTSGGNSGSGGGSASSAGGGSSSGGSSSSGSSDSSDAFAYASLTSPAFTIASNATMDVTISVDEADILSVKKGQKATVSVDALENGTLQGEITKVNAEPTSSSGSVKYSATISVVKQSGMLAGMSATATIATNAAENVLVIPSSALQQRGSTTFVYTKLEGGQPAGETTVQIGLSNGSQVEITSGLSEGDTVYYLETTKSSSSSSNSRNDKGGMNMGGSGTPPSGGPSGQGGPSGSGGGNPPSGGPSRSGNN